MNKSLVSYGGAAVIGGLIGFAGSMLLNSSIYAIVVVAGVAGGVWYYMTAEKKC